MKNKNIGLIIDYYLHDYWHMQESMKNKFVR